MKEFIALRAKIYSYPIDDHKKEPRVIKKSYQRVPKNTSLNVDLSLMMIAEIVWEENK